MSADEADRDEGVDFGDINPALERLSYPLSVAAFVDECGDRSIERTNADPITVGELFDGTGEDTFESPEEVRQSLLNLMPADSVGRKGYSDRGGSSPESDPDEPEGSV